MTEIRLAKPNNLKLGPLIHSWTLPAGNEASMRLYKDLKIDSLINTCPGSTIICRNRCYLKRGFFMMPGVARAHARNLAFTQQPGFTPWMISALKSNFVRVMRVHVGGDFFDIEYTEKWIKIVEASPDVLFFAYTRSWRDAAIFPLLVYLGALPNFCMYWSIDRETGPAPLIRGVRRAYMAIDDADARTAPDDCDLVFRDQPSTVMKKANGVQVCPTENGMKIATKITCSSCGICWNKKSAKWENLIRLPANTEMELTAPNV